ncbi:MAG TPA: SDR family oxidoreductase [Candidatus Aquilonibacter sp.]
MITGASAGIGSELARAVAPKVRRLVLVARRTDRLEELANELRDASKVEVFTAAVDVTSPDGVETMLSDLDRNGVAVDILVNNAGVGEAELFERSPWSRIEGIVDVNITALLRLTRQLLPPMVARGHGAILNIGSGAGYAAMPNAAVYTASKHFVRAFTESLRAQLDGTGVFVCEAAPGPVESEFDRVAGIEGGATPGQRALRISSHECAADIVRQFERKTPTIFPGRNHRRLMRLAAIVPRSVFVGQLVKEARRLRAPTA